MKLFYLDVETTGLNTYKHDIHQLAYMIEIEGEQKIARDLRCRPHSMKDVDLQALNISGITLQELEDYEEPHIVFRSLLGDLDKYCDKFNKDDKFTIVAYNGRFDLDFLKSWWRKCGQQYFGSYFNYQVIDPMQILQFLNLGWDLGMKDFKLETACEKFGITNLKAHDALSDVLATKDLLEKLLEKIDYNEEGFVEEDDGSATDIEEAPVTASDSSS